MAVTVVEQYLAQNKTVEQIEAKIEVLCKLMPGYEDQCVTFVEQYVPQLIEWIEIHEKVRPLIGSFV